MFSKNLVENTPQFIIASKKQTVKLYKENLPAGWNLFI